MLNIKPDDLDHANLEKDVTTCFETYGFLVSQATYHSVMPNSIVKILQNLWTPTALYLRGRADRVAVRRNPPCAIQWEAKTHKSRKWHDMTIEVLPLCAHLALLSMGIKCLYAYRDKWARHNAGFWTYDMPDPRVIMIPLRWQTQDRNENWVSYCTGQIKHFFPNVPTRTIANNRGSGDPFAIIDESTVKSMPHWHTLIDQL